MKTDKRPYEHPFLKVHRSISERRAAMRPLFGQMPTMPPLPQPEPVVLQPQREAEPTVKIVPMGLSCVEDEPQPDIILAAPTSDDPIELGLLPVIEAGVDGELDCGEMDGESDASEPVVIDCGTFDGPVDGSDE
jgi:hypothetical protein